MKCLDFKLIRRDNNCALAMEASAVYAVPINWGKLNETKEDTSEITGVDHPDIFLRISDNFHYSALCLLV